MSHDLFVLVPYFNPYGYNSRRENLKCCIDTLHRHTGNYAVVEVLFPGQQTEIPPGVNAIKLRSSAVLWQKERVINAAASRIDKSFTKIAWLDSNVMFNDKSWIDKASRVLDRTVVAQLFESVQEYSAEGGTIAPASVGRSSIATLIKEGVLHQSAWGYAWAARREFLEQVGLYDRLIVGGGSLALLYGLLLNRGSKLLWAKAAQEQSVFSCFNDQMNLDYMNWAEQAAALAGVEVGVTDAGIHALWHADLCPLSRRARVYAELTPVEQLTVNADGCWEWSERGSHLALVAREMLLRREEDG